MLIRTVLPRAVPVVLTMAGTIVGTGLGLGLVSGPGPGYPAYYVWATLCALHTLNLKLIG